MPAIKPHVILTEEAQVSILKKAKPLEAWQWVSLSDANGRVLSTDVIASHDVPMHNNSAMDGFALASISLSDGKEVSLKIIGQSLAGHPYKGNVGNGQAVVITTGTPIPHGADMVVPKEAARLEACHEKNHIVYVKDNPNPGQHIRYSGEDLAVGSVALCAGTKLGAAQIGLLASLGISEVKVKRKIRVALFSTGDELVPIGRPLALGEVHDSNRYILRSLLSQLPCDIRDLGIIKDDPQALHDALDEAALADVIITTGGVSVGEADYVKKALSQKGEVDFWKINIKPGRPMAFGQVGSALFFGLPGNPVAVMVCFLQFVKSALISISGVSPIPERLTIKALSDCGIPKKTDRREYLRGVLSQKNGELHVQPLPYQGSGVLSSMSAANCFLVLPEDCKKVHPGDPVLVEPFGFQFGF